MAETTETNSIARRALRIITVVAIGLVIYRGLLLTKPPQQGGLPAGQLLPAIQVAGWVDPEKTQDLSSLKGKVLVLDAWASWCGPCRQETAHLVELHKQYASNPDVIFLGITSQSEGELPAMQKFVQDLNVPWPNGYGAEQTFNDLKVEYIPCVWIVNREGKIVWSRDSRTPIEEALTTALRP